MACAKIDTKTAAGGLELLNYLLSSIIGIIENVFVKKIIPAN